MFAKTCPRIDKRGYLYKRGVYNTQLRRRYFVLKGNLLFYYKHQVDEEPLGVIVLAGCSVDSGDRVPELGLFTFIIKFEASSQPTRTFELAAESEKELFDWIQAVQYANYEMLRVVVEDLKARVEAAETERALANPRYSQTVADGAARDTLTGTPPSPGSASSSAATTATTTTAAAATRPMDTPLQSAYHQGSSSSGCEATNGHTALHNGEQRTATTQRSQSSSASATTTAKTTTSFPTSRLPPTTTTTTATTTTNTSSSLGSRPHVSSTGDASPRRPPAIPRPYHETVRASVRK